MFLVSVFERFVVAEAELSMSLPFSMTRIILECSELMGALTHKSLRSMFILVRCSNSSIVECFCRQLQLHTRARAEKTLLACFQKRHNAFDPPLFAICL